MRINSFLAIGSIVAVTFLIYGRAIQNEYAMDDVLIVRDNPLVLGNRPFNEIFTSAYWNQDSLAHRGLYRPLSIASFRWTRLLVGETPAAQHTVNIALHALISVFTYIWLAALSFTPLASLLMALTYCAHPVFTEVVSSVVGRTDLLATLFFMIALLVIIKRSWPFSLRVGLCSLSCLCSFLSKESGIMAVFILPMWIQYLLPSVPTKRRQLTTLTASLLATTLLFIGLRTSVLGLLTIGIQGQVLKATTYIGRVWIAFAYLLFNVQKLLIPLPLSPDYETGGFAPWSNAMTIRSGTGLLVFGFSLFTAWVLIRKRGADRMAAYALLSFWGLLLPVTNLIISVGSSFSERFLYLPTIFLLPGLMALFTTSDAGGRRKPRLGFLALSIPVIFLLGGISWARAPQWKNNETVLKSGVEDAPDNYYLRESYGYLLLFQGKDDQAENQFAHALAIDSHAYEPLIGLGLVSYFKEDLVRSEHLFLKALQNTPKSEQHRVYFYLYQNAEKKGDREKAKEFSNAVKRLNPVFAREKKID